MRPLKRILKSDAVRKVVCWIAANYIRLIWLTGRWQEINGETVERMRQNGQPFIVAFWHGRLLMMPYAWRRGYPFNMLISQHRDGLLIAHTIAHLGIDTVAGSSSKGGAAALRQLLKKVKDGEWIGMTPDGPRGPRMRASIGVVQTARMAGIPVIPATYGTTTGKVLRSWDRHLIPWPFTRGVIVWGDPIEVPREADSEAQEQLRQKIEDAITAVTHQADRLTGRDPVMPAEPGEGDRPT